MLTLGNFRIRINILKKKKAPDSRHFQDAIDAIDGLEHWVQHPPSSPGAALEVLRLILALRSILRDDLIGVVTNALGALAGHKFDSLKGNQELVREMNAVREFLSLGLNLRKGDSECPKSVYLRCSPAASAKTGNFQAITADKGRKIIHGRTTFPHLEPFAE